MTSTYDHRIIQGAESGTVPGARSRSCCAARTDSTSAIFDELSLPHRPVRWEIDEAPALGASRAAPTRPRGSRRSVLQFIHAYRVRGHLVADLDPLDSTRAPHKDLDPHNYGLTMWDLDREFITNGLSGKDRATLREILDVLRDTYCGTIGVEYMYIADPERKEWLQDRMEAARNRTHLDAAGRRRILEKLVEAESFERFLHTQVHRPQALLAGRRRGAHPAARPGAERRGAVGRGGSDHRHGAPRPAERAGEHRSASRWRRSSPSSKARWTRTRPRARATSSTTWAPPARTSSPGGEPLAVERRSEPEPSRVRESGGRGHGARAARTRSATRSARACCRSCCTATRRSPARASSRRRSTSPARRLQHRRHHPRRRQQPDRLHHPAGGRALVHLLHATSPRWCRRRSST